MLAAILRTTGLLELRICIEGRGLFFLPADHEERKQASLWPLAAIWVTMKAASLRMKIAPRKAAQSTGRTWDLGDITEWVI